MLIPVILCGGSGTRLWPLSRNAYPKQLLPLVNNEYSMLQDTLLRVQNDETANPIVICNEIHRFLVAEQLQTINAQQATLILEPIGKNTAPAATIAALQALSVHDDPLLLILPADHAISDLNEFQQTVTKATYLAEQGYLVTFGITPTRPETGYGYIKQGEKLADGFRVAKFVEKPDLATAQTYIDSNEYVWNSGMFLFRASKLLAEMEKHAPDILNHCLDTFNHLSRDMDFLRLSKDYFSQARSESIDYAVMEKSSQVAMVTLNAGWSDVGSWDALWEMKKSDGDGNVIRGEAYLDEVTNSYIHSENRMLAVVGVTDHVIVETADAVLVAHKSYCQNVKSIVNQLKMNNRSEIDLHRRVYRPWGYYEVLDGSDGFQVKRIMVKPGARLSLQSHKYRSEHWVVISGTAVVTRDNDILHLKANQSTYIPVNTKHRLENRDDKPLIIIEVQCGDLISEEDIVRYEDQYGRETCV